MVVEIQYRLGGGGGDLLQAIVSFKAAALVAALALMVAFLALLVASLAL